MQHVLDDRMMSTPRSIVYQPKAKWIESSWINQFIKKNNFKEFSDLLLFSQEHPEEFWKLALDDIQLTWSTPYTKLLGQGLPWPKWAEGGHISIVENCIDRHLSKNRNDIALIFESDDGSQSHKWTFDDLARESHFVSELLLNKNAQPGDRLALLMPMSLEMAAGFFGALRAGLTVIPIFSGYGADAISARLQDSNAKFVLIQSKTTRRGKEIPVKQVLQEALKSSSSVKHVIELDRQEFQSRCHPQPSEYKSHAKASEEETLLLYTSGTTGKPKACVHTSFGVLATTGKELRYGFDVKRGDRFFWYTDIGWMMGPWELFGVLQFGATVVLYEGVPDYPNPSRLWEIIDRHQVTHLGISPTAIRVLKKAGDQHVDSFSLSSLRILGSTGEPWDDESWLWYFEKVGKKNCPIINISGGTEIMGCLLMPSPLHALKPCSLGTPALGAKVQAWTEDGRPLDRGIGHLVCLSPLPSMTKGFLNSKERYLETYFEKFNQQTWYHGDWAFIDDEGFWFLKGRSDDTIKIAGKRIGPNEFESALMEDSRVAESAAIGIPDSIKGEKVHCYVVLKNKSDASNSLRQELQKKCSEKLGKAFMPDHIHFVESLPKTRSGKILRGLIKKIALHEGYDSSSVDSEASIKAINNPF